MEHPLKTARKLRGLSQSELSDAVQEKTGKTVDFTTISKIENRHNCGSIQTYRLLAKALGVDWRQIVES